MKKKEIIFWAVLIGVCIIFASVVIYYKPISAPAKYETVSVHAGSDSFEATPESDDYAQIKKAINKAINSSRYSLLNPTTTGELVCDENTVWNNKFSKRYWVECFPSTGKYKKLFFWVNEDISERQTMLVFASGSKDTYDGGKLLLLYDADTLSLLNFLKEL